MSTICEFWNNYFFRATNRTSLTIQKKIDLAIWKVKRLLTCKGETLTDVFLDVENSESKVELKVAFKKLNKLMSYFIRAAPGLEHYHAVQAALKVLGTSDKFSEVMKKSVSLGNAIMNWKIEILQSLADLIMLSDFEAGRVDKMDEELINRYLPEAPLRTLNRRKSGNEIIEVDRSSKRRKLTSASLETRLAVSDIKSLRKRGVCVFYQFGECNRGASCKFEHSKDHYLL